MRDGGGIRGAAWGRFRKNRAAVAGACLLALLAAASLAGPWVAGHDPNADAGQPFMAPGASHWLGTDIHGRDLLARVLAGTRLSLAVGLVAAAVAVGIGAAWGVAAGFSRGRAGNAMMRAVDLFQALPGLVLVMLAVTMLEEHAAAWVASRGPAWPGLLRRALLVACLGAVSWLDMARVVRGQVLVLRELAFVQASVAMGAGTWHVLRRHLLPHVAGLVIVQAALTLPSILLYESFLSFLGLGVRPPDASLGSLIEDGARQLNPLQVRWWLLVGPGGTLAAALLALQWVADGLRDALDPRG